MQLRNNNEWISKIAGAGLIAKGVVYVMLGVIALMTAFNIGDDHAEKANSKGVFKTIQDLPAGVFFLAIIAAGLICYMAWRFIQASTSNKTNSRNYLGKRLRYIFSGIAYGALAFTAIRIILHTQSGNGDQNQEFASKILQESYGQWIAAAVALLFASIGVYQIYYGLAEKYKKHANGFITDSSQLLLKSAKIGYVSRGIVWLIIAWLFLRAALHSNSSEAGDTGKAFEFIESSTFGTYILVTLSLGVIMYGIFNFIRARYDRLT